MTRWALDLRAALAILTRIPVDGRTGDRTGAGAYAIVGGLVGVAGLVPLVVLGPIVPPVAAILAIAAIAAVSGAIHLDGLADTADALLAVGPEGDERARKDPSVGVGGVVALILVLAIDASALTIIATEVSPLAAGLMCLVAGAVSRSAPVVLGLAARSRTIGSGLGAWFVAGTTAKAGFWAGAATVVLSLVVAAVLGGPGALIAVAGGGVSGLVLAAGLLRARGQLDGDLLGASVELSFAASLVAAAVGRSWLTT